MRLNKGNLYIASGKNEEVLQDNIFVELFKKGPNSWNKYVKKLQMA